VTKETHGRIVLANNRSELNDPLHEPPKTLQEVRLRRTLIRFLLFAGFAASLSSAATAQCVEPPPTTTADHGVVRYTTQSPHALECYGPTLKVRFFNRQNGKAVVADALIDTGSTYSSLTTDLIAELNSTPIGTSKGTGAYTNEVYTNTVYKISVIAATGKVYDLDILGVPGRQSEAILGRDFLMQVTMTYDGGQGVVSIK
jgi:predicted aspartyl protease